MAGSFNHVQGVGVNQGTQVNTFSLALGAAPTPGNMVCVGICIEQQRSTGLTVVDGAGNSYNVTPNSPSAYVGAPFLPTGGSNTQAGQIWLAYILSAPANANKTLTFTWTGNPTTADAWIDEFSFTGGPAYFDYDTQGTNFISGIDVGGLAISDTPVLRPRYTGELLYAASCVAVAGNYTLPTAGGPSENGVWTGSGGGIQDGNMAEYVLSSAAGPTAVDFSVPATMGAVWSAMGMAFYLSSQVPISQTVMTGLDW